MKIKALLIGVLLTVAGISGAAWFYSTLLTNETALAVNKSYALDLNNIQADRPVNRLSAQAVYQMTGSTVNYAGNASMAWYASNDGSNYTAMAVSSATYLAASASTSTATSTLWDFGVFDYRYIKLAVIAPSTGTISLVVTLNGKN